MAISMPHTRARASRCSHAHLLGHLHAEHAPEDAVVLEAGLAGAEAEEHVGEAEEELAGRDEVVGGEADALVEGLLEAEEELLAELALGDEGVEVRRAQEAAGALLLAPGEVEGVVDGADLVARRVRVAAHAAAVGALEHLDLVAGELEVQLAQQVLEAPVRVDGPRAALVGPHACEAQGAQPREPVARRARPRGPPRIPLAGRGRRRALVRICTLGVPGGHWFSARGCV